MNSCKSQSGQTLIVLLVFMIIAITVTTATIALTVNNSKATSKEEASMTALSVAEGGAENAVLRLLRDPDYSGETLTIGDGTAKISILNGDPIVATVEGQYNDYIRKVQLTASYTNGFFRILSWKEIF